MTDYVYKVGTEDDFKDAPTWARMLVEFGAYKYFVEDLLPGFRCKNVNGLESILNQGMFKTSSISFVVLAEREVVTSKNWDGLNVNDLKAGMICSLSVKLSFYSKKGALTIFPRQNLEVLGKVLIAGEERIVVRFKKDDIDCVEFVLPELLKSPI